MTHNNNIYFHKISITSSTFKFKKKTKKTTCFRNDYNLL